jgi:hypothetical protein
MRRLRGMLAIAVLCSAPAVASASGSFSGVSVTNNSVDNSSSGCCPSCAQARTSVGVVSQTATAFTTRFAESIAADARLTTPIGTSLGSNYTINFDVICPAGGYTLTVTSHLRGAFTHGDDSLGCGVGGDAATDLTGVTGFQSGGTLTGSLGLLDPGGAGPTGGGLNIPFDVSGTATISGVSAGAPVAHTLSFSWSGQANSYATAFTCGPEAAVRLGLSETFSPCGGTDSMSADDYPGAGNRDASQDGHIVSVTLGCLCGNGTVDAGEQCDQGAANGTPGSCCTTLCTLLDNTTECRSAAGECDVAENCSGVAGDCPADLFKPTGIPCTADTNDCTDDVCDGAGGCSHPNKPPGASCNGGAGACDGAGVCGPLPTVTPTSTPVPLCAATPRTGCRTPAVPGKSSLRLKNKSGALQDRLRWKWNHGAATTFAAFGDPLTTTNYELCIYDETAGVPSLVASARAPAGGLCANNRACWRTVGNDGFTYTDPLLTPNGVLKVRLKAGIAGKAKLQVLGKGPYLVLPAPTNGKALQQDSRVTVQLVNDAPTPVCWETRHSAPATRNVFDLFKDTSD